MQKPINLGHKIIDAADIHAVKPRDPEQNQGIATSKNFPAEIRALGTSGGLVENLSVPQVVEALDKMGEKLTLLPTGEAVRAEWIAQIKPFQSREGAPNKFASAVEFKHPVTGQRAEEWFAARPEQIPGGKAPKLADLAGGPKS
ncbi:MAG: hypothetical protein ACLP7P_20360 [Rhodomicrobium sp.]